MKHSRETNWRVVVYVQEPYWLAKKDAAFRHREMSNAAEEIAKSVRRHVDDAEGTVVESDTEFTCSHCGKPWTEDSTTYNGGCCAEDEANNPEPDGGPHADA